VSDLQIPGQAVKSDGSDLADPAQTLLRGLELLPEAGASQSTIGVVSGTPYSLQVISSGALTFNKWWSSVVALAGGGGAIWAGTQAYFAKQNTPVQVALVGASAVLGAFALLAVALIVRSDVTARSQTTNAQYAARAEVANIFLKVTGGLQHSSAPAGAQASTTTPPALPAGSQQPPQASALNVAVNGLWVTARTEGDRPFVVIGTRIEDGWRTSYLLARGDETPGWRDQSEITAWGVRPPS
jgi:hypothetical protein